MPAFSIDPEPVWILLRSDAHQDNPHANWEMEERHLEQAAKRNAVILDFGDLFCAMEGKGDRRSAKNLRPEHSNGNYLDLLVTTAADRYEKYAHLWALIGQGNHESSVLERKETDLTDRLCSVLTDRTGHRVQGGGFANWVTIVVKKKGSGVSAHTRIYGHHGYGGGGPVTEDVIQAERKAAQVEGADVYLSGHTHGAWHMEKLKYCLDGNCREVAKTVDFLKLPTYKEEALDRGGRGYHHMKGRKAKPLGAWWMKLYPKRSQKNGEDKGFVERTFERAK